MVSKAALKRIFGDRLAPDGVRAREHFEEWFAESKVVSARGVPLVVFHKTSSEFSSFRTDSSDLGAHFGTLEQANFRTPGQGNAEVNIVAAYLRIANPLRLRDVGSFHSDGIALQLESKGLLPKGEGKRIHAECDRDWRLRKRYDPKLKAVLVDAGYDGVVYSNATEGQGDSYIVFEPSQAKAVYGNTGLYGRSNPDFCDRGSPTMDKSHDLGLAPVIQDFDRGSLLLFHGSAERRTRFEHMPGKRYTFGQSYEVTTPAFFFTPDLAFARSFGPAITAVNLRAGKVLDLREGAWGQNDEEVLRILQDHLGEQAGFYPPHELWSMLDEPKVTSAIKKLGYEVLIFVERDQSKGGELVDTYAVFSADAIVPARAPELSKGLRASEVAKKIVKVGPRP